MKSAKIHTRDILFWTVGVLLLLTLLSTGLVAGLFAKYTTGMNIANSARVAAGLPAVELLEHEAELKDGVYKLSNTEVPGNTYNRVIPGVDIPKDPFVRLSGASEVSYELYVKVVETNFPVDSKNKKTVTYELADNWEKVTGQDSVYRYTGPITGDITTINILAGNQLTVSEHYVGSGEFSLNFSAWIEQVD